MRDGTGERVRGVDIRGEVLEADEVVIAMGPWSQIAKAWMPLPEVYGVKGHSLLFNTGTAVPPQALFLEHRDETGAETAPEVFPRSDGTTYICAISSDSPVPLDPGAVKPDGGAWALYPAGTAFEIAGRSGFDVRATEPTAYLCEFL